jgi:amidase
VHWDERTRIPVSPMIGTIAAAPLLGSISTIDNGPHGGNMDVQEIAPGCRLSLPVQVEGALFYLGDCHVVQGDGELCGIGAIEIRTWSTVRLDLARGRRAWRGHGSRARTGSARSAARGRSRTLSG